MPEKKIPTLIRVPPDILKRLAVKAAAGDRTVNSLIVHLVRKALDEGAA